MEPAETEIKEVFARFGRAYYFAEVLHRGLCNLYALSQAAPKGWATRPMMEEHFATAFGMTLGEVWQRVKDRFSRDEAEAVESAIKTRNCIAHQFWYERSHAAFTSEGCFQLVAELDMAAEVFERADAIVDRCCSVLLPGLGVSLEEPSVPT
jgi:hypothetical protein